MCKNSISLTITGQVCISFWHTQMVTSAIRKKKYILYIDSKMHYKYFYPITANKLSHLPSTAGVAMYRSKLMAY